MDLNNVKDISVSYDESWMTRGHQSHYGIGSVIDLITRLVIDDAVLSPVVPWPHHMDQHTDHYRE